jgi:group I intron endonuclease
MGYIYKIQNNINNKIYIGQTTKNLELRWKQHLSIKSNCRYLKKALNKYGIENFKFKLICITFDDYLDDMEIKYIVQYNCLVPNGYNLRLGGNYGKHNENTKYKISETLKTKYKNGMVSQKPQLGKPHNEKTKKKISNTLKGRRLPQETINKIVLTQRNKRNIKVIQFDIQGNILNSFNSLKEASEYIGTGKGNISNCCNGRTKTVKGYVWKYKSIL